IHIEQRADLRERGLSVGIATTIAGPVRHRLRFTGEVAHAGETPAAERHDALCAAAETVLLAERLCQACAPNTTATAGTLQVQPNALTSIPGAAELGMDIRSIQAGGAKRLLDELLNGARIAADSRGVELIEEPLSAADPTVMDDAMVRMVEAACGKLEVRCGRCVSFAGHDAQHIAGAAPAALLFVASENGVSHAPGEAADWQDVEAALAVLIELMQNLQGGGT
ncbi:MAG TPA: M20/M25/M40 family metallo-hydrolase, partial [Rubrobacteraceae bacterium]|nr:M20/M25/M40 family metallo-hydrolase [Rubrobacteraceae bacterium]